MGTFCYMCDDFNGEVDSDEHVILESFGSPLKSKGLLCLKHNNQFGDSIDKELFAQLGHFPDMLGVNKRKKKKMLRGYTIDNEEFQTSSGLKGGVVIFVKIGDKDYEVTGVDEKEVIKQAKKLFRKHARDDDWYKEACDKLDKAEFKDLLPPEQKIWFKNYLTEDPKMQRFIMNPLMIQSFIKIALNYYFLNGGAPEHVKELISVIRENPENVKPSPKYVRMVNSSGIFRKMRDEDASHVLYIKGCSKQGYLVAFVELFSFFRVMVFMNMSYSGNDIEWSWGYDIFEKKNFTPEVEVKANKSTMLDMQFNEDADGMLSDNYERIISAFNKRRQNK